MKPTNNCHILILPLLAISLLGMFWQRAGQPMPQKPTYLLVGLVILLGLWLCPSRPRPQSWQLPGLYRPFKWQNSGRRGLCLLGSGALPAAVICLCFSLSDMALTASELRRDVDLMLVNDYSGSMTAFEDNGLTRLETAHQLTRNLLLNSQAGKIGLVGFSQKAMLLAPLTWDVTTLANIMDRPPPDLGQSTAIGDALMIALAHLSHSEASQKMILVISDGLNNSGLISIQEAISGAKLLNIPIHTVVIGSETPRNQDVPTADRKLLAEMSQSTNGQLWTKDNFEEFWPLLEEAPLLPQKSRPIAIDLSSQLALFFLIWSFLHRFAPWRARHGR